jgi:hypothetical protein
MLETVYGQLAMLADKNLRLHHIFNIHAVKHLLLLICNLHKWYFVTLQRKIYILTVQYCIFSKLKNPFD